MGWLDWVALAPLVGLIAFRRGAPPAYWLVALGFSVSFFADAGNILLGGSWVLTYIYPALQFGLFALAFGSRLIWALVALAGVQVVATPLSGPDMIVTAIGSVGALWAAHGHALFPTVVAYCFVATALYLVLVTELWRPGYMPLWYSYQAARLVAFALFGRAAWRTATA